jgi:hypothetical protein
MQRASHVQVRAEWANGSATVGGTAKGAARRFDGRPATVARGFGTRWEVLVGELGAEARRCGAEGVVECRARNVGRWKHIFPLSLSSTREMGFVQPTLFPLSPIINGKYAPRAARHLRPWAEGGSGGQWVDRKSWLTRCPFTRLFPTCSLGRPRGRRDRPGVGPVLHVLGTWRWWRRCPAGRARWGEEPPCLFPRSALRGGRPYTFLHTPPARRSRCAPPAQVLREEQGNAEMRRLRGLI